MSSPKAWSRVLGTVYGIRCRGHRNWLFRHRIEYVGMYSAESNTEAWHERIRQHLYGGGPHQCEPKPFTDLVPGYNPEAVTPAQQRVAVQQVVKLGGAVVLWQKRCFYWYVKLRESWDIARLRPANNDRENRSNPRHVPIYVQKDQRKLRDHARLTENSRVFARIHRDNVDDQWKQWVA